jgi:hypothetical protein
MMFWPTLTGQRSSRPGPGQRRPARPPPAGGAGRILSAWAGPSGRSLGAILAIWLAVTAAAGIFATLKAFLITGLIAMVAFLVVWLAAKRPRRG